MELGGGALDGGTVTASFEELLLRFDIMTGQLADNLKDGRHEQWTMDNGNEQGTMSNG